VSISTISAAILLASSPSSNHCLHQENVAASVDQCILQAPVAPALTEMPAPTKLIVRPLQPATQLGGIGYLEDVGKGPSVTSSAAVLIHDPVELKEILLADSSLFASSGNALQDLVASEPDTEADPDEQPETDEDAIVVTARSRIAADPLEQVNADTFEAVQQVDGAIVAPAASVYEKVIPRPVRSGVRNFLANLTEPVSALNFLLQLKPGKAAETLGRFAINTTVGIGGLVDVAKKKPFNLPRRPNGFANTLGFYGVKPGAYLYLPLVGSTTIRDLIGGGVDLLVYPTAIGRPFNNAFVTGPIGVVSGLDDRIESDEEIQKIRDESDDPYAAVRDNYLRTRQAEINALRGISPPENQPSAEEAEVDAPTADPAIAPSVSETEPEAPSS